MIRIITGSAKNIKLKTPKIANFHAVQDVAKGSAFSILENKVNNAQCLDLFTGSGNLGLEALSRGADWCDFVDENKESKKVVEQNIKTCGFEDKAQFHLRDSVKFAANTEKYYDLIFADPFYENTSHIFLMQNLEEILKKGGIIIFFHGENLDINKIISKTNLKVVDERKFGQSIFTLLAKEE